MRRTGSNNDPQATAAGCAPHATERGGRLRADRGFTTKKAFVGCALGLLVLCRSAHVSAQQMAPMTSMDKPEQARQPSGEVSFMEENKTAMSKMMADMTVKPSGNVDADFTAMMIAHHQGAIDMAETELRYGHNAQLRRIAGDIVAEQRRQIAAMKAALGPPKQTSDR